MNGIKHCIGFIIFPCKYGCSTAEERTVSLFL
jgi:hypothetical protein